MTANEHQVVAIGSLPGCVFTLADVASLVNMQCVPVAHSGWPLGLLVDSDGFAWRVGPVETTRASVPVIRVDPGDLSAELTRLLGRWIVVHDEPPEDMPGLDIPQVRYVSLPSLRQPVILDVAKSVAVLATLHHAVSIENDTGRVLRILERAGCLLRSGE